MSTLTLLRHGESLWNKENRFTGWTDVDLTEYGRQQAAEAGQLLKSRGLQFDVVYTSVLKRAIRTMWLTLDEMDLMWLPVNKSWRLNERHYGALQGFSKSEVGKEFGEGQLRAWRRSFELRPPLLETTDGRYPGRDKRYRHVRPDELPVGESLKDTASRLWPCWQHSIAVDLRNQQNVLIVAHGNSLRALVKHLDNVSDTAIEACEIPMCAPLVYELDEELRPVTRSYLQTQAIPHTGTAERVNVTTVKK